MSMSETSSAVPAANEPEERGHDLALVFATPGIGGDPDYHRLLTGLSAHAGSR